MNENDRIIYKVYEFPDEFVDFMIEQLIECMNPKVLYNESRIEMLTDIVKASRGTAFTILLNLIRNNKNVDIRNKYAAQIEQAIKEYADSIKKER